MPDHVHILAHGATEDANCKRLIKSCKHFSGYAYKKQFSQSLWQPWAYERVVRNDEATIAAARYIVENPVRAGLVGRVFQYLFVGSQVYELKALVDSLPDLG